MATFEGTISEFHAFIGPKVRNAINILTKQSRIAREGMCDHCHQKFELESAHKLGNGRKQIIDRILLTYLTGNKICCDIDEVMSKIIAAHQPIEDKFVFLCKSCHSKYDANEGEKVSSKFDKRSEDDNGYKYPKSEEEKINRAIQSIGLECFVSYYELFRDTSISNLEIVDEIVRQRGYRRTAANTRVTNARWLIMNKFDEGVLNMVTKSNRVPSQVIDQAKLLLTKHYIK